MKTIAYRNMILFALTSFLIVKASAVSAEEKVSEIWRGQFQFSKYSCQENGSSSIIIDSEVFIASTTSDAVEIKCPSLIFRRAGTLISSADLILSVENLSGPVVIEARRDFALAIHSKLASGRPGSDGFAGRCGRGGLAAKGTIFERLAPADRRGNDGSGGGNGSKGRRGDDGVVGADGGQGPSITLFVNHLTQNTSINLLSRGSNGQEGQGGGNGGLGGRGGDGGCGGNGSLGNYVFTPGSGGDGGNGGEGALGGPGGNGGNGGAGGNGGNLTVVFGGNSFLETANIPIQLSSIGGGGGHAGKPGDGGRGGAGGAGGIGGVGGISQYAGFASARRGRSGNDGHSGGNGESGNIGVNGKQGSTGAVMWGRPQSIDDVIKRIER